MGNIQWVRTQWAITQWAMTQWAMTHWAMTHWAMTHWAMTHWAMTHWANNLKIGHASFNQFNFLPHSKSDWTEKTAGESNICFCGLCISLLKLAVLFGNKSCGNKFTWKGLSLTQHTKYNFKRLG